MGELIRIGRRQRSRSKARRSRGRTPRSARWLIAAALLAVGVAGYAGANFLSGTGEALGFGTVLRQTTSASAATLVGRASVIDGDTIEIHGERIRLNGVDAPESSQTCEDGNGKAYRCGARAASALDEFLSASSPVRCEFVERDQYGRFVGDCFRADGTSVQEALVRSGWAMDWPRYSNGAYTGQQEAAKAERLGIWVGAFQSPWEWRAAQRGSKEAPAQIAPLVGVSSSSSPGACDIKGNISSKGERIYHLPGQEHYGRTKISTSKGERWFCSEAEARAAGWRGARR
ncbi:thermonuclease family protein [Mesorhizobium sp. CAU 1732]|uniref:thermonuclease family protein n=1 Tax=Mesorhizobium sp. CAU 1732 TaxID=3140358 RepID=UPI003261AECD